MGAHEFVVFDIELYALLCSTLSYCVRQRLAAFIIDSCFIIHALFVRQRLVAYCLTATCRSQHLLTATCRFIIHARFLLTATCRFCHRHLCHAFKIEVCELTLSDICQFLTCRATFPQTETFENISNTFENLSKTSRTPFENISKTSRKHVFEMF